MDTLSKLMTLHKTAASVFGLNNKTSVTADIKEEIGDTVSLEAVCFDRPVGVCAADWAELVEGLRYAANLSRLARGLAR